MAILCSRRRGMQTLLALLGTALACALARPPVITDDPPPIMASGPERQRAPFPPPQEFLTEFILPRFLLPHYMGNEEQLRLPSDVNDKILDREIDMINQMELQELEPNPYDSIYPRWDPMDSPARHFGHVLDPIAPELQMYPDQKLENYMPSSLRNLGDQLTKEKKDNAIGDSSKEIYTDPNNAPKQLDTGEKNTFALTPRESGYYENTNVEETALCDLNVVTPKEEEPDYNKANALIDPRKTRQNPNLSKTKTLIAEHVDKLRTGFTREDAEGTAKPHQIHILETPTADPSESIYGIAFLAAVGAAITIAMIGFAFGWYTLSKKAKAAADVDYPAYGVTGPNVDTSGDRKLAQSAHMYHYQHQKQQIIAMERNGMDRNGSVSDPESEEENEEGDYTVYECPGFATTGDMEVKNPLFKEEATPATPAKSDGEKDQPKE